MKKISIIVATYNGEKYIEEQINSLLSQTVLPHEIIISDNNSSDKTRILCENLLNEQKKVDYKILIEKEKGVLANFQNGLRNTTGDYIFFCDQDDIWYPNKIAVFMDKFNKYPSCNCVFSDCNLSNDENISMIDTIFPKNNFLRIKEGLLDKKYFFKLELYRNIITGMSLAITKQLKEKILPFSINVLHDYWTGINSVFCGDIYYIDEFTSYYRQHADNVVGVNKKKNLKRIVEAMKLHKIRCNQEYLFLKEIVDKYDEVSNDKYLLEMLKFKKDRMNYVNETNIYKLYNLIKKKSDYKKYISDTNGLFKDILFYFGGDKF